MQIIVKGIASNKSKALVVRELDLPLSLLEFLQSHDLPIASSCGGLGSCAKCLVNKSVLSCQITVSQCLEKYKGIVEVSYL